MTRAFRAWTGLVAILLPVSLGSAHAESAFLVQLGSFPTEQEATQKWEKLKSSHGDVLGAMTLRVSEALSQPDNVTVYRTQAGPLPGKKEAQSVCARLASAKVDCFVVETAMFTAPNAVDAEKSTAQASVAAPLPPELPNIAPSASASDDALAKPAPSASDALQPIPAAMLADAGAAAQNSAAPVGSYTVKSAPAAAPMPVNVENDLSKPGAKPVQVKEQREEDKEETGLSRFLPFFGKSKAKEKEAVSDAKPVSAENAAPAAAASAVVQELATQPKVITIGAPVQPVAAAPAPASAPVSTVKPLALPPVAASAPASTASSAAPLRLVAPPVSENRAAARQPATLGTLPPLGKGKSASAQVNVAEAVRVPLSSAAGEGASGRQSGQLTHQPAAEHNLWAQLSFFNDEQSAFAYWDELRAAHSELASGVRARVTRPYQAAQTRDVPQLSLRVGPFAYAANVRQVCEMAARTGLRCSMVKDIGGAAPSNVLRNRPGSARGYHRSSFEGGALAGGSSYATGAAALWAQLGAHGSEQEALDAWQALQAAQPDVLSRFQANILPPAADSQGTYRLRVGPFASSASANGLCRTLAARGVSCVVAGGTR